MVRAKFKVVKVEDMPGPTPGKTIWLEPVYTGSLENERFYRMTPGGQIVLSTINAEAAKQFEVGAAFYVDFTSANYVQPLETPGGGVGTQPEDPLPRPYYVPVSKNGGYFGKNGNYLVDHPSKAIVFKTREECAAWCEISVPKEVENEAPFSVYTVK